MLKLLINISSIVRILFICMTILGCEVGRGDLTPSFQSAIWRAHGLAIKSKSQFQPRRVLIPGLNLLPLSHTLDLTVILFKDSQADLKFVQDRMATATTVLQQCGIGLREIRVLVVALHPKLGDANFSWNCPSDLERTVGNLVPESAKPAVIYVRKFVRTECSENVVQSVWANSDSTFSHGIAPLTKFDPSHPLGKP
jgi:hypothetical protein